MLSEDHSELQVQMNSLNHSTNRNTTSSSIQEESKTPSPVSPSHSKSHPTTGSEMKSIRSVTSTNYCQINQREISSSMLTMTRRCYVSLPDLTHVSQKMLTVDLSFHSSYQTILSKSLNPVKRTLALWKANSWNAESIRMLIRTTSSSHLLISLSEEMSRSMDITTTFYLVMITPKATQSNSLID